jgi:DnaD/phage-associated family protein
MKALGRRGEATEAEVKCIQKWYEQYEFSKELILCACEKAVMAVDTHRMEYADKILSKWYSSYLNLRPDL